MKLALIADIHSNIEAFDACLAHARDRGAQRFALLGDLVGYNADPVAVVARAMQLVEAGAAVAVQGNHDAAAAGDVSERMNEAAAAAIRWTQRQLAPHQADFLRSLPLVLREGSVCLVHASAAAPERWVYVMDTRAAAASLDAAESPYVFCGHVHDPLLYYMGADRRPQPFLPVAGISIPVARHRRWLSIVGSCGQPRDGDPRARYALFDIDRALLTFHRIDYDQATAAGKVRRAGLPEEFARRLESGR
ncbi:MAG: metallophosphatase family protein [Rhodocyclaceae bacterium]|nr:metallophosphatase family protein [Rhodocyclaceae bacterium]